MAGGRGRLDVVEAQQIPERGGPGAGVGLPIGRVRTLDLFPREKVQCPTAPVGGVPTPSRNPRYGVIGAERCRFTQSTHKRIRSLAFTGSDDAWVRPANPMNSVSTPLSFMA